MIIQAKRMANVPLSRIREIMNLAYMLEKQGRDIIHLEMGEPDFTTPSYICDAAQKALEHNRVHYAPIMGTEGLQRAIIENFEREYGVRYDAEEVLVTTGVAQGIYLAMLSTLNPGDEVLIPDPGYNCYSVVPNIAGAKAVGYPILPELNYQMDFDILEQLVTSKTRAIVLINPSNPCGSIFTKETLQRIAEFACKHNLLVIADEIYSGIVYDDEAFHSFAAQPGIKDRTIILNGFSKYYAMTGWRIGYLVCDRELMDAIMRLSFYMVACVNTFVQDAAEAALRGSKTDCIAMRDEFSRRRNYIVGAVNKLPGCSCSMPKGAFYAFMDVRDTGMTSEAFSTLMLEKAGVATTPGTVFGENGKGFVRLSYANSMENLQTAMERMRHALTLYGKENRQ
jgi:aspartate/methionine/tyrosine aminotransferase